METTTSFYATLPSNACMDFYPENKQSSFKIELPQTLYLTENYEVALVEMQYPVTWKTFGYEGSYTIKVMNRADSNHPASTSFQQIYIPSTYYQNMEELLKVMNETLVDYFATKEFDGYAQFHQNKLEQRVQLKTSSNAIFINLQDECSDALGFERDQWLSNGELAPYSYDISRGFHSLFVYCSICKEQIVGNHSVKLLRNVAITGKRGEHVIKGYGVPHYVPVNTDQVTTIEINIKDDTDQLVPFVSGKVVCKLHFRQQKNENNT